MWRGPITVAVESAPHFVSQCTPDRSGRSLRESNPGRSALTQAEFVWAVSSLHRTLVPTPWIGANVQPAQSPIRASQADSETPAPTGIAGTGEGD